MTGNRTGYRPVDRLIELAEKRGLNIEVDRSRGETFVVVRITNDGLAGANHLNDAQVSLFVSFGRSARGRWAGGSYTPMLGKQIEFTRRSVRDAMHSADFWIRQLWVTDENVTDWDRERLARERAEDERIKDWLKERGIA